MSAAAELARRIEEDGPGPGTSIIAIEGRAGTGKTTFGEALAGELGGSHVDIEETYPGWEGLEEGSRLAIGELVLPISRGETAVLPQWDWVASRPAEPLVIEPPEFLVVSGTGCGAEAASSHLGLLVWMELDDAQRRRRALERDGDIFALHWDEWSRQVEEHLSRERTRERADVIVDTSGPEPVLAG